MISGEVQVRTPAGTAPARIVMFSSAAKPSVCVYPDGGKVGVWAGGRHLQGLTGAWAHAARNVLRRRRMPAASSP